MLKARHISKKFGGIKAVRDCSLTVHANEVIGIIGPNGAGKSTLLNLLTGIDIPDSGRIRLDGVDITNAEPWQRYIAGLNRSFQDARLFRHLTIRDNLSLGNCQADTYVSLLKQFNLTECLDSFPSQLSLGQQRLVEIIRALSDKSTITVLDEPFSGIYRSYVRDIIQLIYTCKKRKRFVIVDHDTDMLFEVCDRILIMDDGRIVDEKEGSKTGVLRNHSVGGVRHA